MAVPVADQRRLSHILADDLQPRIDWAYGLEQGVAVSTGGYVTVGNGDPNGLVTKPEGYLFLDLTTPAVWQNANGGTVWTKLGAGGSSTGMSRDITQVAHGLVVSNPIRYNGTAYVKAKADSATNAEVVGLVSAVADADHFTVQLGGRVTGLAGLTAGEVYFLSEATAGTLTAVQPSSVGQVSKPLLIADSTTSGYFFNFRGAVISTASTSLLEVVVNLSAAQLLTLDTVDVAVLAAPGAGKLIFPVLMTLVFTPGSRQFQISGNAGFNGKVHVRFPSQSPISNMPQLNMGGLFDQVVPMVGMENTGGSHVFTQAAAVNQPMTVSLTQAMNAGPVLTSAKNVGGSGYAVGDTGTLDPGGSDAAYVVDTVSAGAVLTYHLTVAGSGYLVTSGATTSTGGGQPGIGTGFTVDINSVDAGNGTAKITLRYAVIDI